MGKKQEIIKSPKLTLAQCIEELNLINGNIFSLKQASIQLIEAIESGNMEHAKAVLKIYDLKQILDNLTPKI